MSNETPKIARAMQDLAELRNLVAGISGLSEPRSLMGIKVQITVHVVALALCSLLCILELVTHHNATNFLYASYHVEEWRFIGVGTIAAIMLALMASLYLVTWRSTRGTDEPLAQWLERNLLYSNHTAFISDLFVKFAAISCVILARRPDWVAPLLVVFTGDYLLQRRFFVLPATLSRILGLLCLIWGTYFFIYIEGLLLYAYPVFIGTAGLSLWRLLTLRNRRLSGVENE
jgi:hypothetical protein